MAERHGAPIVTFDLVLNAGEASDPAGSRGVSRLDAQTMLDGTADLDALAFDDRKLALGVALSAGSGRDTSQVFMSAPSARLDPALDLMADVVLKPAFRPDDLAREKAQLIAGIKQSKQEPTSEALRVAPKLVYGADHPYGRPTTEASVASVTPEDLKRHHDLWFQPKGATLVVAGDTTLEAIMPKLEARFGAWRPATAAPVKDIPPVSPPSSSTVYLIDKPGALQSVISASIVAPPKLNPDDLPIQAMLGTLGGQFTSRLNLNLREDKHWAYGAFAFMQDARGPSLLTVLAPVQTDKTKESFVEVKRELTDIIGARPITAHELELVASDLTLSRAGRWEAGRASSPDPPGRRSPPSRCPTTTSTPMRRVSAR